MVFVLFVPLNFMGTPINYSQRNSHTARTPDVRSFWRAGWEIFRAHLFTFGIGSECLSGFYRLPCPLAEPFVLTNMIAAPTRAQHFFVSPRWQV